MRPDVPAIMVTITWSWQTPPPSDLPHSTLEDWFIVSGRPGDAHICGRVAGEKIGRVSTAIVEFWPVAMMARTHSGRIYTLSGPPGRHPGAEGLWRALFNGWGIHDSEEITIDFLAGHGRGGQA